MDEAELEERVRRGREIISSRARLREAKPDAELPDLTPEEQADVDAARQDSFRTLAKIRWPIS